VRRHEAGAAGDEDPVSGAKPGSDVHAGQPIAKERAPS
jgi:hypothetical protein